MKKLIETYLSEIQNDDGLWIKIKKTFEFASPKHPVYIKIINIANKNTDHCRRSFPAVSIGIKFGKFSYDSYKENPKFVICYIITKIEGLKNLIEFLNNNTDEEICKHNINKERCTKFVGKQKENLEIELKQLERDFQIIKGKKATEDQFNKFMKRLM